ncbi:MAG: terminase large subunit [Candidatus Omnitrophica bacterium]|nr:terminase large subunit [Candidatus Omnitrophota bacterium]
MPQFKNIAINYAENVLDAKILACKWTQLAAKRFLSNLKRTDITFDDDALDRVVSFFQMLKHCKGEWAGQYIHLEAWQIFVLANIFAFKKNGIRLVRTVYLEVARKNGKSTLLSGIGLYLTRFDNEGGAEVYSAATTRDQAKIVFDIAKQITESSDLKRYLISYKNSLECPVTKSKFEPLSSDYDSLDGLNIHGAIIDELHAHKTRDLYDVLDTGAGARRQPLIMSITTAGYDKKSICWQMHEYTEKVLEKLVDDDTFFGAIYTLDEGDDWEDETNWIKSNPSLGVSVKEDDLRRQAKTAKEIPSQTNAFLCKRLNVWTEALTRWIPAHKWEACNTPVDEAVMRGRMCYAGLDLSSTTDVSAFVLVFPPKDDHEKYKVLCRFWLPEDNMHERVKRDRVPYDAWVRQGYIITTPGDIIDYSFILHQISSDAQDFDMRELAFDRWGSTKIIQDLQDMGFEGKSVKHAQRHLVEFGQGYASMAGPTKELEKMVIAQEIAHGGNPVLAWMMSNVEIRRDPAGNMKPDKGSSREKIDGVVGLIMGLALATREDNPGSVYEKKDLLIL